jgi:hypothetical protein
VFGTLKYWMGSTHFLTRTLEHVSTEMSLHVLALLAVVSQRTNLAARPRFDGLAR